MASKRWIYQGIAFECDENKRKENLRKHHIDLFDTSAVFFDPLACARYDNEHSESEDRIWIIGRAEGGTLLFVVYTIRGKTIRIISARQATKHEAKKYE